MVLNQLKQIRDDLKKSAESYDEAFKNTALIAAESLLGQQNRSNNQRHNHNQVLNPSLEQEYFIKKYGNLKQAKAAYKKIYGEQKYGRSWESFIKIARELLPIEESEKSILTLEQRLEKIEKFLETLGYKL